MGRSRVLVESVVKLYDCFGSFINGGQRMHSETVRTDRDVCSTAASTDVGQRMDSIVKHSIPPGLMSCEGTHYPCKTD